MISPEGIHVIRKWPVISHLALEASVHITPDPTILYQADRLISLIADIFVELGASVI